MHFYMLRNKAGDYFKRSNYGPHWVSRDQATVWTNLNGPRGAKGLVTRKNMYRKDKIETEIVIFEGKEV